MSEQPFILAVDIGTSGARAVLFDAQANHLTHVRQPYETLFSNPGWSEQDPEAVVDAVLAVLRAACKSLRVEQRLAAVVLSSQMYSVLALDHSGRPLCHSMTWGDTRSTLQAAVLRERASPGLMTRTGCPLQAIYPLAKIRWLLDNQSLPTGARFVSIKDYVVYRLTGQLLADRSTASASGLLDISRFDWDAEALELAGISKDELPELVSTRHSVDHWLRDISVQTGIPSDTSLIIGAGDAPLANIGVGAIRAGTMAVNIGTSAAARVLTSHPHVDDQGRLWTYVADAERWVTGGIIGGGGAVYEWVLKKLLFTNRAHPDEDIFREAQRLAESVSPGSEGLVFLPYLSGEQNPGWQLESRGMAWGMTFSHESRHYIRAVIEGIIFALLRVAEPVEAVMNTTIERAYLTGGLGISRLWARIVADIFGIPVVVPRSSESSARGAAILGLLALGMAENYEEFSQPEDTITPDAETHTFYQQVYQRFCSLNDRVQGVGIGVQ